MYTRESQSPISGEVFLQVKVMVRNTGNQPRSQSPISGEVFLQWLGLVQYVKVMVRVSIPYQRGSFPTTGVLDATIWKIIVSIPYQRGSFPTHSQKKISVRITDEGLNPLSAGKFSYVINTLLIVYLFGFCLNPLSAGKFCTRQTNPIFTNQWNYAYLPGKMRL